jgi:dTDP-D-glucose 4,6-dehydratase
VQKIISEYFGYLPSDYQEKYLNLSISREGQDIRYALNDDKLRSLGWKPQCSFDNEIKEIVQFYKNNFIF